MDTIAFLKLVNLFSGLKEEYLAKIAEHCVERSFEKGEVIIRQGEYGTGLFIIKKGRVKIVKELGGGDKLEIVTHEPGDFIGEMTVLDNKKRSASVIAFEDTTCLVITAWDFKARMKTHPEIALELLPVVVKRFRETNDMLCQLSSL